MLAIVFMLCSFMCFLLRKLPLFGFLWKLFATFYIVMLAFFVVGALKGKIKKNFFS